VGCAPKIIFPGVKSEEAGNTRERNPAMIIEAQGAGRSLPVNFFGAEGWLAVVAAHRGAGGLLSPPWTGVLAGLVRDQY
jgi:hypothetical protein